MSHFDQTWDALTSVINGPVLLFTKIRLANMASFFTFRKAGRMIAMRGPQYCEMKKYFHVYRRWQYTYGTNRV